MDWLTSVSWTGIILGLLGGIPLGLLVMGTLAGDKVREAYSLGYDAGYVRGRGEHEAERLAWEMRIEALRYAVQEMAVSVNKLHPATVTRCEPETERALEQVDLGVAT